MQGEVILEEPGLKNRVAHFLLSWQPLTSTYMRLVQNRLANIKSA